ncbi:hypothetical protein Pan44_02000 [Caulifigura coniformis]|uniref:EF hand n=1 Tax=Caulifigura coniformis TaxID=2527983 RepID=A0A517S7S2_9PLAN|nr:DUF1549 domain-containing protein [Caulifigura coniformis]QDT52191.1 hypothetical protein Pan44_02000 [Caulifigura coniformis]
MNSVARCLLIGLVCLATASLQGEVPEGRREHPSEVKMAREIDRLLEKSFEAAGVTPAGISSDEDFLRRVSLDLAGTIPTPREVTLFGLDPDADKRAKLIDRLLDSKGYSDLWAAYWGEVIFGHATEQRARGAQGVFEEWMTAQLAANRPWSEITTALITATGKVQDDGQTALMFAHTGNAEEIAAEVSRIFLGIQLQCANCHDHPTDGWKREQFHELAAYLPRVSVRRQPDAGLLDFEVTSFSGPDVRPKPAELARFVDRNRDGRVTAAEAKASPRFERLFGFLISQGDADKDGALSMKEIEGLPAPPREGRGSSEHYMPDLNDPTAKGTMMQPVFFLSGQRQRGNSSDLDRREALAKAITSKSNPWFRKAFVNRMWGELLGEGFFMPIDDMGPKRSGVQEDVLEALANGFASHGYDIQWLLRTITSTQAYQRQLAGSPNDTVKFAAATPTRLRSDQIYNAMAQVLGVEEMPGLASMRRGPYGRGNSGRRGFQQLFGYDPSTPQADILGNIPQVLFMMNADTIAPLTRATGDTALGRILTQNSDDGAALDELYLRVLSREPTEKEREINLAYIKTVGRRNEAFEDIFWSLLNSSEFLTKR